MKCLRCAASLAIYVFTDGEGHQQWVLPNATILGSSFHWFFGGGVNGELFQSELFWRVIFMQIRLFIVINLDSLQSQLSSNT